MGAKPGAVGAPKLGCAGGLLPAPHALSIFFIFSFSPLFCPQALKSWLKLVSTDHPPGAFPVMPRAGVEGELQARGSHGCWFSPGVLCLGDPEPLPPECLPCSGPYQGVISPVPGGWCWWHKIRGSHCHCGHGWSLQRVCAPPPRCPQSLPAAPGQTPAQAMPAGLCHSRSPPCHQHPRGGHGWDGGSRRGWFTQRTLPWRRGGVGWYRCCDGGYRCQGGGWLAPT